MDYNTRMVDKLHERWLDPPNEGETDDPCFSCYDESQLRIGYKCYCEQCAKEEYVDYSEDEYECCICGEFVDTAYRVGNDFYCENCFLDEFRK